MSFNYIEILRAGKIINMKIYKHKYQFKWLEFKIPHTGQNVEELEFLHTADRNVKWHILWKTGNFLKLIMYIPCDACYNWVNRKIITLGERRKT